jgi:hypothetical protein
MILILNCFSFLFIKIEAADVPYQNIYDINFMMFSHLFFIIFLYLTYVINKQILFHFIFRLDFSS